jgi:hypothetical protein
MVVVFNKLVSFTSLSQFLNFFHKFNAHTLYRNHCFWILLSYKSYKSEGLVFGTVVVFNKLKLPSQA